MSAVEPIDPVDTPDPAPDQDAVHARALAASNQAQQAAGVAVRALESNEELSRLDALFSEIWALRDGDSMLGRGVLRALVATGNYVVGVFADDRLVGGCVAFAAQGPVPSLHSHIAGISQLVRGRRIGFALKLHQREWAVRNGYRRVEWTYDPLVRRNAHFNITKLGGRPVSYLTDFYGPMNDGINTDSASDRILLRWELSEVPRPPVLDSPVHALLEIGSDGLPFRSSVPLAPDDGRLLSVRIPTDIEQLRQLSPSAAARWRMAVRETLGALLADGAQVVAFDNDEGYLVEVGR